MANDPKDPTTVEGEHQPVVDRVLEPSMHPDGTADQMDGYEVIDPDEETAAEEGVPQVSGAAPQQEESTTSRRRSRKADVETTAER